MIDIETVGTGPEACILTIAAQTFEPLETGYNELSYYARVDFESQPGRNIEDGTIQWWATQPAEAREEAFNEKDRIPLGQALEELGRIIWTCKQRTKDNAARIWANGPTFDMNILEHAYKSFKIQLPWQYYRVRDARTIYGLWPDLPKYPASHHALEDCRRQIDLLQATLKHLDVKELA